MHVQLEYIKFRNVLSYGAKEVEHRVEQGLTMMSGRNGAGKSTLLEVLCYNWYGKPYRKIKLEALINRVNKKGLETETRIIIDKKDKYRIIRGMKPNTLKVFKNDTPFEMLSTRELNQDEITKILGIDYKMFKQIVSLAVTYNKPFLTQEAAEKREIVESIFNIKIIGSMLEVLKKNVSAEKVKYTVNKKTVEMLQESINIMRKHILEVKTAITEFEKNKLSDIDRIEKSIIAFKALIEKAEADIKEHTATAMTYETDISAASAEIVKQEAALKLAADDTSNPAIDALIKEIEVMNQGIKDCESKISELVNAPVQTDTDEAYVKLVADRIATERLIAEAKTRIAAEDAKEVDYNTDPKYAELIKQEEENKTKLTDLSDHMNQELEGANVNAALSALSKARDEMMRSVNDSEKNIKDEKTYIEYLKDNNVCQKCKAKITPEFKTSEITKAETRITLERAIIVEIEARLKTNKEKTEAINKLTSDIASINSALTSIFNEKNIRMMEVNNKRKDKKTEMTSLCSTIEQKLVNINNLILSRIENISKEKDKKLYDLRNEVTSSGMRITLKQSAIDTIKKEKSTTIEKTITQLKNSIEQLKIKQKNSIDIITNTKLAITEHLKQIEITEKTKTEITERKPPHDLDALNADFKMKITDFQQAYKENGEMAEKLKIYDIAASMLSEDGIKSFFFKRLTPILNAKINEYLDKFEIPIRVKFNEQMEEELFNIGNEKEIVSYYSYSEGEKKSIDIAILMSFIDITKTICNWYCNILMIDELIDGQVDTLRMEKMMECLRDFAISGAIPSIYIISHRQIEEVVQFFKRSITVNKVDGFSELTVRKM